MHVVKISALNPGDRFRTLLTGRIGIVHTQGGKHAGTAVRLDVTGSAYGEEKGLHPDIRVEAL